MSFSLNGPEFKPMIQESQSMKNNGGGGNTGYYQRGKKKKEKQINVFPETDDADTFLSEQKEVASEEKNEKFINKLIEKTKKFVKKAHNNSEPGKNNPFKQMEDVE